MGIHYGGILCRLVVQQLRATREVWYQHLWPGTEQASGTLGPGDKPLNNDSTLAIR